MTYAELHRLLQKSNWTLKCRPEGQKEFREYDYWYLTRERLEGQWEIDTQNESENHWTVPQ